MFNGWQSDAFWETECGKDGRVAAAEERIDSVVQVCHAHVQILLVLCSQEVLDILFSKVSCCSLHKFLVGMHEWRV